MGGRLWHAHEVQHTSAELKPFLEVCGLTFLRDTNVDEATREAYRTWNPHDPAVRELESVDQFEAERPDAFDGPESFGCANTRESDDDPSLNSVQTLHSTRKP